MNPHRCLNPLKPLMYPYFVQGVSMLDMSRNLPSVAFKMDCGVRNRKKIRIKRAYVNDRLLAVSESVLRRTRTGVVRAC